jgi:hypothetical protein
MGEVSGKDFRHTSRGYHRSMGNRNVRLESIENKIKALGANEFGYLDVRRVDGDTKRCRVPWNQTLQRGM